MRRVIATVLGTVISLVLLLSFKTHSLTSSSNAATPPVVTTPSSAAPATGTDTFTVPSVTSSASASASASAPASASASASSAAGTTTTAKAAPTTTKKSTTTASRTVQGDAINTRYGNVQVQVTLAGTKITDITILQVPDREQRDVEINDYAVPILRQEALAAQGAQVDMVSGATYTSVGYLQSLQSALDKAKTS